MRIENLLFLFEYLIKNEFNSKIFVLIDLIDFKPRGITKFFDDNIVGFESFKLLRFAKICELNYEIDFREQKTNFKN